MHNIKHTNMSEIFQIYEIVKISEHPQKFVQFLQTSAFNILNVEFGYLTNIELEAM